MIVDDDPVISGMLAETVNKWGYGSTVVTEFHTILDQFVKHTPKLVLMDINLPVYDGFYWCEQIRGISNVPILFLSSRDTPMDMIMAMNMGGDDYVQKPFFEDVLMAKIKALLRRAYSYVETASDAIEHNGLVLNISGSAAIVNDKSTELTKNELKMMTILMRGRGNIVSREKIMRGLWEDESFVDDNTLTVNMTRLRKKLSDLGKPDYIHTVKGEGYVIR